MKAVILAAGGGTRLLNLTEDLPKCLLPIGSTTILGSQLANLEKSGIKDVIISAGYKSDLVREYVKNFKCGLKIVIEYNPFYDISNNIMSLWNVREYLKNNNTIIINGDNIFHYKILVKLIKNPVENVLMVNTKDEYDGDDMKIKIVDGIITKINKTMKSSESSGESIGIMKFSSSAINKLINKIVEMSYYKDNLQAWYLKAIQELIKGGLEIVSCNIENLMWQEVDFPEDYKKAKELLG